MSILDILLEIIMGTAIVTGLFYILVSILFKNRMDYPDAQFFADDDFGKYEDALGAATIYLKKWYSASALKVIQFMLDAIVNPGKLQTRESEIISGRLINIEYFPKGMNSPAYVRKHSDQNRWVVSASDWKFEK